MMLENFIIPVATFVAVYYSPGATFFAYELPGGPLVQPIKAFLGASLASGFVALMKGAGISSSSIMNWVKIGLWAGLGALIGGGLATAFNFGNERMVAAVFGALAAGHASSGFWFPWGYSSKPIGTGS